MQYNPILSYDQGISKAPKVRLDIWQEEPEVMAWKMELKLEPASLLFLEEFGSTVKAWQNLRLRSKGATWGKLAFKNN